MDPRWLEAFDRISERLAWGIWPLLAVGIAVFSMWIIAKMGSAHVRRLSALEKTSAETAVIQESIARVLDRVAIRIDEHDDKEMTRHGQTLAAFDRQAQTLASMDRRRKEDA